MNEEEQYALTMMFNGIIRVIAMFVCGTKANTLNRNVFGWVIFGLFFPIIAMIWVNCIKPIVKFEDSE